jgi:hypothetical protein
MMSLLGITGVALGAHGWSCLVNTLVGAGDPIMETIASPFGANITATVEVGRTRCDTVTGTVCPVPYSFGVPSV